MRRVLPLFIGLLLSSLANAMPGGGNGESNSFMDILPNGQLRPQLWGSIQTNRDYFEARFNYEDQNTLSFFYGRPFYLQKRKLKIELVPSLGISGGKFNGVSPCFYVFGESKRMQFYSTNQFSLNIMDPRQSFFFNWSEGIYKWKNTILIGVSTQVQCDLHRSVQLQSGLVAGIQYKSFCANGYFFNLWSSSRSYLVGLTYSFSIKPHSRPKQREQRISNPPIAKN